MGATKTGYEVETIPWYKFGHAFLLFENIKTLFIFPASLFPRWMANSLIYSFSSTLVSVIICALAGFGLAAYSFKGKKVVQGIILFLAMVPSTTLILPLFLMFAGLDLINTPWSVILPNMVFPLGTFIMYYYLSLTLNFEAIDAARLDRASDAQIFFKIVMPSAYPALAVTFLLSFIQSWNSYFLPLVMLSDPKIYPLTVGLGNSFGGHILLVASVAATIPVLIIFLTLQRFVDVNRLFHQPPRRKGQDILARVSKYGATLPAMNETSEKLRVPGADGFRAIACLLVLFHHAAQRFNPDESATWIKAAHFAGWRSEVGVALFFVLSGCLLSLPFWNSYVNALKPPRLVEYARNRIARIVPGVWVALIVSTYVAVSMLGGEFQRTRFWAGFFFVYSFYYKTFFPVDTNGPLWTIGLEVWSYICLPLVLITVLRFKKNIKLAFAIMFGWIILLQGLQPWIVKRFMTEDYEKGWDFGLTGGAKLWMPYWNFASFFTMFLLGSIAALAIAVVRSKKSEGKYLWDAIAIVASLASIYIVLKYEIPGTQNSFTLQPYMSPWYPALIALALFSASVGKFFWKLLDNRLFRHIARVSFGLYLWHWLFLTIVERKLPNGYWENGAKNIYAWLGMIVFTYGATWAVAGFSFKYFESPILRWNRRDIARRRQKSPS